MITAADLRASPWVLTMHADGADKTGRFWINTHRCKNHPRVTGSRQSWRGNKAPDVVRYMVDDIEVANLEDAADRLNAPGTPFTVGDDSRGIGTDD